MKLSPIALFVYNRPWHARQTVEALLKNDLAGESELIVFSDGPLNQKSEIIFEKIRQVREYLRLIKGFKSVRIVERQKNFGLADSIISGVTEVVNKYGRIIVLEDDMVTSPYFLRYMNDALEFYEKEEKVISIHGYVYPINGLPETFFIRGADCWGWATWKRGWDLFEPDGKRLLKGLKEANLLRRFDFDGAYPYSKMLKDQIKGKNNSWAIRWYASAIIHGKITLYPGISLVNNIGLDASGTHRDDNDIYCTDLAETSVLLGSLNIAENKIAYQAFRKFFNSSRRPISKKLIRRFCRLRMGRYFPEFLRRWYRLKLIPYGYKGDYSNWTEATRHSSGYNTLEILKKVKESTLKLKAGKTCGERDSVTLDTEPSPWLPLKIFQKVSVQNKGRLTVIDYGGALGCSYYQHRNNIGMLDRFVWLVIEQENFVKCGNEAFADDYLRFSTDISSCPEASKADILLLSSVLQYMERPYDKINGLVSLNVPWIIVDRAPLSREKRDIMTVQRVNPKIYNASYPAWLLDKERFLGSFKGKYELVKQFHPIDFDYRADYCGFIFKLR